MSAQNSPTQRRNGNEAIELEERNNGNGAQQPGDDGGQGKNKNEVGWRRIVRNFTPSWFSVIMGTGITSIMLHSMPYNSDWQYYLSIVIFVLNAVLFFTFLAISIARYTLYPEIWGVMIKHPAQSLFLGTFPMGFATLVNMWTFVCVPAWGPWAATFAWAMWWIDSVVAVAICFYLPFILVSKHEHKALGTMTAGWLLPVVAPIVSAASGSIVAGVLPNPTHALWTLIISYTMLGTALPLAFIILALYFQRLALHHLPAKEVITSSFLPIGPLGQGGFALINLGKASLTILPATATLHGRQSAEIFYNLGFLLALLMWGFALMWLFFALSSILSVGGRKGIPFNMGWWAFTFPLGVLSASTILLGKELSSRAFDVTGMIFASTVCVLWLVVFVKTALGAYAGQLFHAPCLGSLQVAPVEAAQPPPV